ncbi:hypothetical protein Nepgr_016850 [Nepenthes gracilis]|uniref:Altered inheritance of mitochondria protein 32 n=1 Tax=Nepenthes gracilis TaxID=150966 RepID=A0AAD3SQF7_NEPGR|nr:hypothetical protein Nepgr_016850 [Nepenthes gracilis]
MAVAAADDSVKYGFERPEMYSISLAGTVDPFDRHVFLCYKNYESWPSHLEKSEIDLLPKLLFSALKSRKDDMKVKTRLTVCGGCKSCDGNECSDGDIFIFPELIKYRGLKDSNVDAFVDEVLVKGQPWASGVQEELTGAFVFVCAHASRDKRCGICGPVLIERFEEEIQSRGLENQVFVSACSHIGGHKYAGNVIIFGTNSDGKVTGDWYGYVTPNDVPDLLDVHIGKGGIIERIWRGQMGLYVGDAEKATEQKPRKEKNLEKSKGKPQESASVKEDASGCCQGAANGVSCCGGGSLGMNGEASNVKLKDSPDDVPSPAWIGKWKQSDILMAAAVAGAVAAVGLAYSFYRRARM